MLMIIRLTPTSIVGARRLLEGGVRAGSGRKGVVLCASMRRYDRAGVEELLTADPQDTNANNDTKHRIAIIDDESGVRQTLVRGLEPLAGDVPFTQYATGVFNRQKHRDLLASVR